MRVSFNGSNYNYIFAFFLGLFTLSIFLNLNHEIYLPIGSNLSDYSGDGAKNLYTFAYYLKYDVGVQFTGLFYPFGDLVTYMDAQPFWVWVIKAIEKVFHFHIENPIIYIHLILLFNLWICSVFLFLILHYYSKNYFFTALGTFIIVFLSPQIFRFSSHYSLGSMGIIPLFWWWYIHLPNKKIFIYILWTLALTLIGFIHPYLLLMMVFLFLSYELIYSAINKKINWLKIASSSISVFLFQFILKFFDKVQDRPINVWGSKEYTTKIDDILLPLSGGLKTIALKIFPNLSTNYSEGHGYISIFGIFVLIILIAKGLIAIMNKQFRIKIEANSIEHWTLATIPILLFAFFIPFKWEFMDWALEIITPLKQFRGTGRFVFVFYYVFLVFTFVYLSRLYKNAPKKMSFILIIGTIITLFDIYNNHQKQIQSFHDYGKYNAYNYFKSNTQELFSKVDNINDYQCIVPYPPSTEGTEIMWLEADWKAKINYYWFSYFNRLPLATLHSSRASFSNTMEIVQLSGYNSSPKPILKYFKKGKKCLLIAESEYSNKNIPIFKNAELLNSIDGLNLYSIDIQNLQSTSTLEKNNDWIDTSHYTIIGQNNFDNLKEKYLLFDNLKEKKNIFKLSIPQHEGKTELRILFWYIPNYSIDPAIPIIEVYKIEEGQETFLKDWREAHTQTYNYRGDWFCVDYTFIIDENINNILFKAYSKGIVMDDLTIYQRRK